MLKTPIKVLVADDHPVVRDGILASLAYNSCIHVIKSVSNFTDAQQVCNTHEIDVIISDILGMGGSTVSFVTSIKQRYPHIELVMFSSSIDMAPELLELGVKGYVVKEELSTHLTDAVMSAAIHKEYLSPIAAEYVERVRDNNYQVKLSSSELNVLKYLSMGYKTLDIAAELGIDPRTVQNYITTMRRKTGCTERIQLVEWYRSMYRSMQEKSG